MIDPVLYSFRRCPYAMRARMAILFSGQKVQLREVVLKHKPAHLCAISPKATVPVLFDLDSNHVIEESLEIMQWALKGSDLLENCSQVALELIQTNDGAFKSALDKYKYYDRFPEQDQHAYLQQALPFLTNLDARLANSRYLMSDEISFADLAIFPFVRQFAHVDLKQFADLNMLNLSNWLDGWLEHDLFKLAMTKYQPWQPESDIVWFGVE